MLAVLTFVWTVLQHLWLLQGHMALHQREEFFLGDSESSRVYSRSLTLFLSVCGGDHHHASSAWLARSLCVCTISGQLFFVTINLSVLGLAHLFGKSFFFLAFAIQNHFHILKAFIFCPALWVHPLPDYVLLTEFGKFLDINNLNGMLAKLMIVTFIRTFKKSFLL